MTSLRMILFLPFAFALVACNKDQPSGVPETPASTAAPQQPVAPPPPVPVQAPVAEVSPAPPAVQGDIPPYEKTGFPACDDYVEAYRQCLNSRLAPDARKEMARELQLSVRAIVGNISRGVDAQRVAQQCQKARGLATKKVGSLGCTL